MKGGRRRLPLPARALLRISCPSDVSEAVQGDLEEEYRRCRRTVSDLTRFWTDVLGTAGHLLVERLREVGWTHRRGGAFRGVAGALAGVAAFDVWLRTQFRLTAHLAPGGDQGIWVSYLVVAAFGAVAAGWASARIGGSRATVGLAVLLATAGLSGGGDDVIGCLVWAGVPASAALLGGLAVPGNLLKPGGSPLTD